MALAPELPDGSQRVCAVHLRRGGRRQRAALGHARRIRSDPCPTPPGATTDGCVVTGRLSRLTAADRPARSRAHHRLVPAVPKPLDRHAPVWRGRLPVRVRGRRRQLHLRRLRSGRRVRRQPNAAQSVRGSAVPAAIADPRRLRAGRCAPRTCGRQRPDVPGWRDPPGRSRDGPRRAGKPARGERDHERAADHRAKDSAIHSASRSGPGRTRCGSAMSAGPTGRRSTASSPRRSRGELRLAVLRGRSRRPGGYDGANLSICENLYAAGAGAVVGPYYTYNHANKVVAGESCPTGSSSIAGMAFSNGGTYPASTHGALFFADYSRDCIWVMYAGANGLPDPNQRETFAAGAANPVGWRSVLAATSSTSTSTAGTIRRDLVPIGNGPPTRSRLRQPRRGPAPLAVNFSGAGSLRSGRRPPHLRLGSRRRWPVRRRHGPDRQPNLHRAGQPSSSACASPMAREAPTRPSRR